MPALAVAGTGHALAFVFIGYTGFVIKPLREAGVMTVPELFEKRFSKRVRWSKMDCTTRPSGALAAKRPGELA